MQAAGLKIHCVEMRKITAAANAYVQEHREELIEEAAAKIATRPGLRKLAEQDAKAIRKTSLQQGPKDQHRRSPDEESWATVLRRLHFRRAIDTNK
jgi:hypothetical protein